MGPRTGRIAYGIALVLGAVPLWVTARLPMVDLPQHLHLISVLHRLHDPSTLYPVAFQARGNLTPYLGYYYLVSALNWLMPLHAANALALTAYVIGLPLSMGFLLRSLGLPRWPSVLAIPFAYGDSFAWGFLNWITAIPLALLCCGFFVRAITEPARRVRWAAWEAVTLVAVLLFHVQAFAFLALALPFLLVTVGTGLEPHREGAPGWKRWVMPRVAAVVAVVPGVVLFLLWVVIRVGEPAEIQPGVPWKAWGPMLSPQNLSFKPFEQNRSDLLAVLANMLRDGSDRYALWAVAAIAVAGLLLGLKAGTRSEKRAWRGVLQVAGLAVIALAMFFALPFDIRGYIYYLNTRYAHLAAPLVLAAIPPVRAELRRYLLYAGLGVGALVAFTLGRGFAAFGDESRPLAELAERVPPRPRVMGLIYATGSAVVKHPVYLHAAAVVARAGGGITNFSFALTPHSPLEYRIPPPDRKSVV